MNNTSTSEYSSGCESGWTMYFDQLSNYTDPYNRACVTNCEAKRAYLNEDQDDEDLSMVSDASSGPPNWHEPENEVQYYDYMPSVSEDKKKSKSKSKSKSKTKEPFSKKQQSLCLDDTASSPIFHFSQGNAPPYDDHDKVFSAADFQDESTTKKHFGFFISSKQKSGSLLGRKKQ